MRLTIHLTPKASYNKIEGWAFNAEDQKILRVKVTAVPENGKANEALINILAKALRIPKSKISLIRGETSKIKELEIEIEEEKVLKIG